MDIFDDEEKIDEKPLMEDTPVGVEPPINEMGEIGQGAPKYTKEEIKKKHLIMGIIAAVTILVLIAASISIGVFIGANMGINKDMGMLVDAYKLVKKYYYKDITWREFQEIATANAFSGLDPFLFVDQIASAPINGRMGVTISTNVNNHHFVSFVDPGSPADEAVALKRVNQETLVEEDISSKKYKLEQGDEIAYIGVEGEWVDVVGANNLVLRNLISQSDTQMVKLRVLKHNLWYRLSNGSEVNADEIFYFDYYIAKKDYFKRSAFYYSPSEIANSSERQDVGLIKLTQFSDNAAYDFAMCINEFISDPLKPQKLILDLRDNGGGAADILAFIATFLINSNSPVKLLELESKQPNGKFEREELISVQTLNFEGNTYNASYLGNLLPFFEVNILANKGTASSSEVLIANLLYFNQSKLIGETTFGKGIGQKIFPLGDGYTIAIPNGKYYLPSIDQDANSEYTYNIHEVGISPMEGFDLGNDKPRPIKDDRYIRKALTSFD